MSLSQSESTILHESIIYTHKNSVGLNRNLQNTKIWEQYLQHKVQNTLTVTDSRCSYQKGHNSWMEKPGEVWHIYTALQGSSPAQVSKVKKQHFINFDLNMTEIDRYMPYFQKILIMCIMLFSMVIRFWN